MVNPNIQRPFAVFVTLLATLVAAHDSKAIGLGQGTLKSYIGQQLNAEIEVLAKANEVLLERCFRLVTPLDREPDSTIIHRGTITLTKRDGGTFLRITTPQMIVDPIAVVTIRVDCNHNLTKEYNFLPDPRPTKQLSLPVVAATTPEIETTATTATTADAPATAMTASKEIAPTTKPTASPSKKARRPRPASTDLPLASANTPPPASRSQQPEKKAKPRQGARDRISIRGSDIDDFADRFSPVQLKMSTSLSLQPDSSGVPKQSPQLRALQKLEQRIANRASSIDFGQYDPKQRLQELNQLLVEAKQLSSQIPEAVNLPTSGPPIEPVGLASSTTLAKDTSSSPNNNVTPSSPAVQTEDSPLFWRLLAIFVALSAATAYGLHRRRKEHLLTGSLANWRTLITKDSRSPVAHSASPLDIFRHATTPDDIPKNTPNNNAIKTTEKEASKPAKAPPKDSDDAPLNKMGFEMSVSHGFEDEIEDELTARLETAEVMICFHRFEAAAAEIEDYVRQHPSAAIRPQLALLSIYRRGNMMKKFDELSEKIHKQFNVETPIWKLSDTSIITDRHLENFNHVMNRIVELWGTPKCLAYIRHLTTDNRSGKRAGFSIEAAEELGLLEGILMLRTDRAYDFMAQEILDEDIFAEPSEPNESAELIDIFSEPLQIEGVEEKIAEELPVFEYPTPTESGINAPAQQDMLETNQDDVTIDLQPNLIVETPPPEKKASSFPEIMNLEEHQPAKTTTRRKPRR